MVDERKENQVRSIDCRIVKLRKRTLNSFSLFILRYKLILPVPLAEGPFSPYFVGASKVNI